MSRIRWVALATVLAMAQEARANESACWLASLEKVDHALHPPRGGDTSFFTRSSGPPNTYFLLANSTETKKLPGFDLAAVPLEERGCGRSSWLNGRRRADAAYDHRIDYPDVDPGQAGEPPGSSDKGFPGFFSGTAAYRYLNWTTTGASGGSIAAVCNEIYGALDPNNAACQACLVDGRSYYLHPTSNDPSMQVFHGNWLRFFPPAHVMLRRVFKQAVVGIQRVRMGVVHFGEHRVGANPHGAVLQHALNPPCNLLGDTSASWTSNRGSIVGDWDGNGQTPGFGDAPRVVTTPLGEALLGIGAIYGDRGLLENTYVPTGFLPGDHSSAANDNHDSICVSCQFSSVIVIGDGSPPDPAIEDRIPPFVRALKTVPPKSRIRLGRACTTATAELVCGPDLACDETSSTCVDRDVFDNVAQWLWEKDLRNGYCGHASHRGGRCDPEQQEVATYTISVGRDSSLYESAAKAGGGLYFRADDADQLTLALQLTLKDILRRSTSFSAAASSTMQTRGTTWAFIPRFRPQREPLWPGWLYRFKLFNEFAAGCTVADTQAPFDAEKRARNPNADADCDDVYLLDRRNRFVGENEDGEFMLLDTSVSPWEPSETPAEPVWEAAQELATREDPRRIHTVIDTDADGRFEPEEQVDFSTDNLAALLPALALGGLTGPACIAMAERIGTSYAAEEDCARDLIQFVRGRDVFDEDFDLVTDEPRPKILGDVFHSSPALVTPPVPQHLCDLGVATQCVFSLYGPDLTPGGAAAYEAWRTAQQARDQFVLVGANDGMLHAFHAGTRRLGDDPETKVVEPADAPYYDLGTGEELWAFVPPDLLPKLKRLVLGERHELFVDGSAMVRDVWVDTSEAPHHKEADEFRTMAVVGERGGGRHSFALDVTDPAAPRWRWGWPLPGSTEALEAGESWNDVSPAAAPIVPVALEDSEGPLTVAGRRARERWVYFLNGGYDRDLVRGRSISVLDVWTGERLWAFARRGASAGSPAESLFPVASPVGVLDLGPGASTIGPQDGLFDTAVVGDLGGQVWTLRFHEPGSDASGDGTMDNWFGARAFVQHADEPFRTRSPFFHLPSAAVLADTGIARVYLGSGDRENIREVGGGACGLDNLLACVRKECSVDVRVSPGAVGEQFATAEWKHRAGHLVPVKDVADFDTAADGATCSDAIQVREEVDIECGAGAVSYAASISCDTMGACSSVPRSPSEEIAKITSTEHARFYSIRLFDGASRAPFRSVSEAETYDSAALTDDDLVDADVALASSTSPGFRIHYPSQDERTASASGLLSGCTLWNTLTPEPGNTSCGAGAGDLAKLYRAHYVTGASSCGVWDTLNPPPRSVARHSLVPPPAPSPLIAVNPASGEVRFNLLSMDPGRPPGQTPVGSGDIAGLIHWIEVPRRAHACRHEGVACR